MFSGNNTGYLAAAVMMYWLMLAGAGHAGVNHWTPLEPDGGEIKALLVLPDPPGTVFAGTLGGLFRSLDGGQTWTRCGHPNFIAVYGLTAVHQEVTTIFAADPSSGVYKSTDGGESWTFAGLNGNVILFDLKSVDTNPPVLYAATFEGLFHSEDLGENWAKFDNASPYPIFVRYLAVDHSHPDLIYAGSTQSCLRSDNGGESWQYIYTHTPTSETVTALAAHPYNGQTVYLGTEYGFYVSHDRGDTWTPAHAGLPFSEIQQIAVTPETPGTVYCSTWAGGICRSRDEGQHWTFLAQDQLPTDVLEIAFDPDNPSIVYAGTERGVSVSPDSGQTWSESRLGLRGLEGKDVLSVNHDGQELLYLAAGGGNLFRGHPDIGWELLSNEFRFSALNDLAVCPLQPDWLMAGTAARYSFMMQSDDGGASWTGANAGMPWEDIHQISFVPDNENTLYAVSAEKIFRTDNQGADWKEFDVGFQNLYWHSMAMDPWDPCHLFFINGYGEIVESFDAGVTLHWRQDPNIRGGIFIFHFDPFDPQLIFLKETYCGDYLCAVYKSTDGGATWEKMTWTAYRMVMDPHHEGVYYIGQAETEHRFLRSDDHGQTWQTVFGDLVGLAGLGELYIDPHQADTFYCVHNKLYTSVDGGASWSTVSALNNKGVNKLVFDPVRPGILYALTSSGTFKTTDHGAHWTLLSDFPIAELNGLAANQSDGNILYAASYGGGIHRSTNLGDSWQVVNNNLGDHWAKDIVLDPTNPSTLGAATLFKSAISYDRGESWLKGRSGYVRSVAISPGEPKYFVSGTSESIYRRPLYDPDASWTNLYWDAYPPGIGTDFVCFSGSGYLFSQMDYGLGLYRWTNDAVEWERADFGIEDPFPKCLESNPYDPDVLYYGGSQSVYITENNGQWWRSISFGLQNRAVYDLVVSAVQPDLIYAATSSGFLELQLGNGDLNLDDVTDSLDLRLLAGYFAGNGPLPVTDNHADHSVDGRLDATDLVWQMRKTRSASAR